MPLLTIHVYNEADDDVFIYEKSKKFILENPDFEFSANNGFVYAKLLKGGRMKSECPKGDGCCLNLYDSVDDFLSKCRLEHFQEKWIDE